MRPGKRPGRVTLVSCLLVAVGASSQSQDLQPVSATQILRRALGFSLEDRLRIKCGTPLIFSAFRQWDELSPQGREQIRTTVIRYNLQKSRLSSTRRFKIHYDTSSTSGNTPALLNSLGQRIFGSYEAYVDSVAEAFDHSWRIEVDSLRYEKPPPDSTLGGGPEYDIYIINFNDGTFGYTQFLDEISLSLPNEPNQKYTTHIVIENDFQGYRTPGISGLKVTAAHELHHAIQIGRYGIWTTVPNSDFYFNELTSSWMEDVVYTSVNDYYFDVIGYFQGYKDALNRSLPFTFFPSTFSDPPYYGYERSIWAHFLAKRFGLDIIRQIWNGGKAKPLFQSMKDVLAQHGTSIESEYELFGYWNFFTADRADASRFYPEGAAYPRYMPNSSAAYSGSTTVFSNGAFPFSLQMYELRVGGDTMTTIIVNSDADAVIRSDYTVRNLEFRVTSGIPTTPYHVLSNGLKSSLVVDQRDQWHVFYRSASAGSDIARVQSEASPNPLRLSDMVDLALPVREPVATDAEVFVLSSSLDLVFSDRYRVTESFGNRFLLLPAGTLQSRLASGVYFVVARVAESEYRWKLAVIQ